MSTKSLELRSAFYAALKEKFSVGLSWAFEEYEHFYKMCESPIEKMLFEQLYCDLNVAEGFGGFSPGLRNWLICPQYKVGKFRVDFAVGYLAAERPYPNHPFEQPGCVRFAVECDGHAFHEKTKEQAAKDKARDRFLTANGWRVMRFTGSEIYRDAAACSREIETAMRSAI